MLPVIQNTSWNLLGWRKEFSPFSTVQTSLEIIPKSPFLIDNKALGSKHKASSQLINLEDIWDGDKFHKASHQYTQLKTVIPVFTPAIENQIHTLILKYKLETGKEVPPAQQYPTTPLLRPSSLHTASNKQERLEAVLWIFNRLPAASSKQEALNQMACVLALVESLAHARAKHIKRMALRDSKPMRLTEPLSILLHGKPIWISYGIRHVTLFNNQGAVQVQQLPSTSHPIDYQKNAQIEDNILINKHDQQGHSIW